MASMVESLPSELLDRIIAVIDKDLIWDGYMTDANEYRRSMLSISSVSRTFRQSCDPFIYRAFPSSWRAEPVRPFLRSICERPQLAQHVRTLQISMDCQNVSAPNKSDRQLWTAAMSAFASFDWYEALLNALLNGCHKAEATMLFAFCTNIRELRLGGTETFGPLKELSHDDASCNHCDSSTISACMHSLLTRAKTTYPRITHLQVHETHKAKNKTDTPVISRLAGSLLTLPRLRSLKISQCDVEHLQEVSHVLAGGTANTPNLDSLQVRDCDIGMTHLAALLRSSKDMRMVEITWKEATKMDVATLFASLERQNTSLHHLQIGTYWTIDIGSSCSIHAAKDGLRLFTELRSLEINDSLLIGNSTWDTIVLPLPTLPAHLMRLTLHTTAAFDDLGCILTRLRPHIAEEFSRIIITFPVTQENAKYVDMIRAIDLVPLSKSPDVPGRPMKGWSVFLSRGDGLSLFIEFCCMNGKKSSIGQTFDELAEQLTDIGIGETLTKYFDGCQIDESTTKMLEIVREVVRGAWPDEV